MTEELRAGAMRLVMEVLRKAQAKEDLRIMQGHPPPAGSLVLEVVLELLKAERPRDAEEAPRTVVGEAAAHRESVAEISDMKHAIRALAVLVTWLVGTKSCAMPDHVPDNLLRLRTWIGRDPISADFDKSLEALWKEVSEGERFGHRSRI